jgi:hypothetical protein
MELCTAHRITVTWSYQGWWKELITCHLTWEGHTRAIGGEDTEMATWKSAGVCERIILKCVSKVDYLISWRSITLSRRTVPHRHRWTCSNTKYLLYSLSCAAGCSKVLGAIGACKVFSGVSVFIGYGINIHSYHHEVLVSSCTRIIMQPLYHHSLLS